MNITEAQQILDRPIKEINYDRNFFRDKTILITGAGGSIGSALAEELSRIPSDLILLDIDEIDLFSTISRIRGNNANIIPVVGDVSDEPKLTGIFREYSIDVVIHTAAYKHLPMMETQPSAAVKVNVIGTSILSEMASRYNIERFLLISTDKAVKPTSIMGQTKKLAEEICLLHNTDSTSFHILRFGNVLGSRGSVVEIFREKISRNEPIIVTHPEMERFFIHIREATGALLKVLSELEGGLYVFNIAPPLRIIDLARRMLRLYSRDPGLPIKITSPYPGEKLREELIFPGEKVEDTLEPTIKRITSPFKLYETENVLENLKREIHSSIALKTKEEKIRSLLASGINRSS